MPDATKMRTSIRRALRGLLARTTKRSDLAAFVDGEFYGKQLGSGPMHAQKALSHYLSEGWQKSFDPSPKFSTRAYVDMYPDLAGTNPLLHFVRYGRLEGRMALGSGLLYDVDVDPPSEHVLSAVSDHVDTGFYVNQTGRNFSHRDAVVHYLTVGWKEGLDPSPIFSTKAYLEANPTIAVEGESPLLHYLNAGNRKAVQGSSYLFDSDAAYPSSDAVIPFLSSFDAKFYARQTGRDLSPIDGVRHYLGSGWKRHLDPSPDFSTRAYLRNNSDVVEAGLNPLDHYIRFGKAAGRPIYPSNYGLKGSVNKAEKTVHVYQSLVDQMNLAYYQAQVPEANFSGADAAEHYMAHGWKLGLSPHPDFVPKEYLEMYPEVAAAGVQPYWHYISQGIGEGRRPRRNWNSARAGSPRQVLIDIKSKVVDGAAEWTDYAYVRHLGSETLESREPDLQALDFTVTLAGLDPRTALSRCDLSTCATRDTPKVDVSVIIPSINEAEVLLECLASLGRAATNGIVIEIVLVDNGSSDAVYTDLARHANITYLRFDQNVGFGNACNAGAEIARGGYLFFLNNDAQVAPGALERLITTHKKTKAGIVGPKILSFDGRLQEAGCFLRMDGTGQLIGYSHNPNVPRFNYLRKVDHVSGAAILMTRALFRSLGGFDPIYAPAYCEDADLSLKVRAAGYDLVYEPRAVVAHHLSKTSNAIGDRARSKRQRIAKNRQTLVSRWSETLAKTRLRTIGFYLPQYHPIPENDFWWGKGFTEWTNLGRSKPNFEGHLQPRVPADLGYYDLRLPSVMEQQAAMALRYGLSGFCYYYYNFDGKRLLETPLEAMLRTGRPDFPFCLCWANENWTKRWDGLSKDVLMEQSYSEESLRAIANDLIRYCRSSNYITVDGRPLILIYRVSELSNPRRIAALWRNVAREAGVGEIMLASVESFNLSSRPIDPTTFGCDISVEFPPHDMITSPALNVDVINEEWKGSAHDYRDLAAHYMTREEAGFRRFRSVLVGWDNTPRYREKSLVLEKTSPGAFQAWLEWTMQRTLEQNYGDERLVFINAWNEWCEGSYMEPDQHFGHGYLVALRNAISNIESGGYSFATGK